MRRQPARISRHGLAIVVTALAVAQLAAGVALAQTTTTTPTATTTQPTTAPTTAPVVTTTPATTSATTAPSGATTVPGTTPTTEDDGGGSDIPWVPIGIGAAVVVALVLGLMARSRRRGGLQHAAAQWSEDAAAATADAGATARLLAEGTPANAAVAQQVLASLRAFDELERSAPDDAARSSAQRARRVVQNLGLAIDADHEIRRAQPPALPDRIEGSAASLRSTAANADRALRALYRGFTETG